jgi:hypothetical protein
MSAGLEWNENLPLTDQKNSEMRMLWSADQYRYVLEQPVVAPGGQVAAEMLANICRRDTVVAFMLFPSYGITCKLQRW